VLTTSFSLFLLAKVKLSGNVTVPVRVAPPVLEIVKSRVRELPRITSPKSREAVLKAISASATVDEAKMRILGLFPETVPEGGEAGLGFVVSL